SIASTGGCAGGHTCGGKGFGGANGFGAAKGFGGAKSLVSAGGAAAPACNASRFLARDDLRRPSMRCGSYDVSGRLPRIPSAARLHARSERDDSRSVTIASGAVGLDRRTRVDELLRGETGGQAFAAKQS